MELGSELRRLYVRSLNPVCGLIIEFLVMLVLGARGAAADGPDLYEGLAWRCIGPAVMGGRIDDVAVVERDPAVAYVATATAGLWKTTNHGTTFAPIFDDQACQSIGAVAVCQSRPEIVWVGTGEANNRQSSSWGCGVFKSTDGGQTWHHMGLEDTLHIARIAISPRDPDTVYVAAVGHLWGANEQRGLYRTTDGGTTWKAVLQLNPDTGCTDVVINPKDPSVVYAAMYQRRRAAWGFIGGGPGSGIYRSTDGGNTWQRLDHGLPSGDKGRIGLDIYRNDPRIVYAVVEAKDGGVFRSEDGGDTWKRMSSTNPRPMYFSKIRVDPNDDQFIWLGGVSLMRSKDGGKTFGPEPRARLHADIHAIWINPADSRHMLVGCDGGIQWSHDRGETWDHYNTIPLAQFYALCYDMETPYNVAGGLQDNGSWYGPSSRPGGAGPTNADWKSIGGGDGFYCAIDWRDPVTAYCESQNGAVRRVNVPTVASKSITPMPPPGEPRYRWDWCTPFMLSPHNPRKILLGGNRLFISMDRGDTWRRTEDLSTSPKLSEMVLMGVKRGSGYPFPDIGSDYGQIVTITESPLREGLIYVGTDDGNLQVSRDDGKTWKNVAGAIPGLPAGTYVSRVHASAHAEGRVYASFDGHRADDYRPYIYVSEDYGETWRSIAQGIPVGSTVNVIREHPHAESLLFAGTDRGLYVSLDRGTTWRRFGKPLPPLRVDEVLIHPRDNDLVVATHARGVYILDDIAVLVAEASGRPQKLELLQPRPAVQYRGGSAMSSITGNRQFITRGAPTGALIRYFLPRSLGVEDRLMLTIEDKHGRILTTRRLVLGESGYNSTTWDLRADPPGLEGTVRTREMPGSGSRSASPARQREASASRSGQGATGVAARGARVPPGEYVVRLRLGDQASMQRLVVLPERRLRLSQKEYEGLYAMVTRLLRLAAEVRRGASELAALESALSASLSSDAVKQADRIIAKELQGLLEEVKRMRARASGASAPPERRTLSPQRGGSGVGTGRLSGVQVGLALALTRHAVTADSVAEVPSHGLRAEIDALEKQARGFVRDARRLCGDRLRRVNGQLKKRALPLIVPEEAGGDRLGGAELEWDEDSDEPDALVEPVGLLYRGERT